MQITFVNKTAQSAYFHTGLGSITGTFNGAALTPSTSIPIPKNGTVNGLDITSAGAAKLLFSLGNPLPSNNPGFQYNDGPGWNIRWDKVEMTLMPGNPSSAMNLSATDFYGLDLQIQTYTKANPNTPAQTLTWRRGATQLFPKLATIASNDKAVAVPGPAGAPGVNVPGVGNVLRVIAPSTVPPANEKSYPSMQPYVTYVQNNKIVTSVKDLYTNSGSSDPAKMTQKVTFSASIPSTGADAGKLVMTGSGDKIGLGHTIVVPNLATALISANPDPFYVDGRPDNFGNNDAYGVVVRDMISGFNAGLVGSTAINPNSGHPYSQDSAGFVNAGFGKNEWFPIPNPKYAFAGAQPNHANFYNQYAATLAPYSDAYSFPFSDVLTSPLASIDPATIDHITITILPDSIGGLGAPAPASGGQFVFGTASGQPVVLGVNDGTAIAPGPVDGAYNIEVFTALPSSITVPPAPDPGFQAAIVDQDGQLADDYLTGDQLFLGGGDYQVSDAATGSPDQSPAQIWFGSGAQSVTGGLGDTLVGGSGDRQVLNALAGDETVLGGSASESIFGGAGDSIVGGTGIEQIVATGPNTTIDDGSSGRESITAAANDVVEAAPGDAALDIDAGAHDLIDLSSNFGNSSITGAVGNVITAGGGTTHIDATAGFITINIGAGATEVTGSNGAGGGGVTVRGGSGSLDFNPAAVVPAAAGAPGDLIDLSGGSGGATINAFSNVADSILGNARGELKSLNDTIMASNGADSVWGGPGGWIGAGRLGGAGSGSFEHASTQPGGMNFGTFDSASAVVYGTAPGQVTVEAAAGASSAKDTVTHFNPTTDNVFYASRSASNADASIVATATSSGGNTTIVLPDGTTMTFMNVASAALLKFIS